MITLNTQDGAGLIAAKRLEQIATRSPDIDAHDDSLAAGELADAGAGYAQTAGLQFRGYSVEDIDITDSWPWSLEDWRATSIPVENLVKAGVLIAAEIDRVRREFKRRCNEITDRDFGFECFGFGDADDICGLDAVDWVGRTPQDFIEEHFSGDYMKIAYEKHLEREANEQEATE